MQEAVKFWLWSYDNGYFVRWSVSDKKKGIVIATVELFHRDDEFEVYGNIFNLFKILSSAYLPCS